MCAGALSLPAIEKLFKKKRFGLKNNGVCGQKT
jgi:hypothetical protein